MTVAGGGSNQRTAISTHTLTWSVTRRRNQISRNCKFQLTRSRGAWRIGGDSQRLSERFQLTRSRGAWHVIIIFNVLSNKFQLTRSRGAWRFSVYRYFDFWYFNSHAHVERDFVHIHIHIHTHTFQLTRSRGAWPEKLMQCVSRK